VANAISNSRALLPSLVPAGSGTGASRLSLLTDPRVTRYWPTPISRRIRKSPSEKVLEDYPANQLHRAQDCSKPEFGPARVGWAWALVSNLPTNQHQSEASHVGWRCCSPARARLLVVEDKHFDRISQNAIKDHGFRCCWRLQDSQPTPALVPRPLGVFPSGMPPTKQVDEP